MSSADSRSEDVLGKKWDSCVSDTLIKMGSGLGVGIIFSVFLFKRKTWPVVFGLGSGLGMGYSNCQQEFNSPFTNRIHKIMAKEKESVESSENKPVEVEAKVEQKQSS